MTGWVMAALAVVLAATLAVAGITINAERKKAEREKERIRQEGAENAERTARAIERANMDKSEVRTGDHGRDLDAMARKLHDYANRGK